LLNIQFDHKENTLGPFSIVVDPVLVVVEPVFAIIGHTVFGMIAAEIGCVVSVASTVFWNHHC